MSAVFDDFGDPDRSPRAGKLARVAHWMPIVLVTTMLVRIAHWFDAPVPAWLGITVEVVMLITLLTLFLHQGLARICLRCMEEVKPDAPLRAQRKRGILWLWHFSHSWKWVVIWLGALVLSGVVRVQLKERFGLDWPWVLAPTDIVFFLWIYSVMFHHRVSPWCPYCRRWDDGGDHEPSPDPVEPGTKVA